MPLSTYDYDNYLVLITLKYLSAKQLKLGYDFFGTVSQLKKET